MDAFTRSFRNAAVAALALATSCGIRNDYGRPPPPPDTTGGTPATVAQTESLHVTLEVPHEARAGEPVRVLLRVRNGGSRAVDLYLRGREPTLDVVVETAAGDTVWRRLEGAVIPAIAALRALAPGEILEVSAVWDQRRRDGSRAPVDDYRVRGMLLMETAPLSSDAVPLRINAP